MFAANYKGDDKQREVFRRPLLPPAKPGVWPSRRVLELKQAVLYTQELELPVFRTLDFSGRLIKDTFNGFSRTWMHCRSMDIGFCALPMGGRGG
jgi:hypothetical protein